MGKGAQGDVKRGFWRSPKVRGSCEDTGEKLLGQTCVGDAPWGHTWGEAFGKIHRAGV